MLACRWGSDVLGLKVVNLMTLPGNIASERVAQKAGFAPLGMVQDYKPPRALDPEAQHEVKQWVLRGVAQMKMRGPLEAPRFTEVTPTAGRGCRAVGSFRYRHNLGVVAEMGRKGSQ